MLSRQRRACSLLVTSIQQQPAFVPAWSNDALIFQLCVGARRRPTCQRELQRLRGDLSSTVRSFTAHSTDFNFRGRHDILKIPISIIILKNHVWLENSSTFHFYRSTVTGRRFFDVRCISRYNGTLIGDTGNLAYIKISILETTHR